MSEYVSMGEIVSLHLRPQQKRAVVDRIKLTENRIMTLPKPPRGAAYTYDTVVPCLSVRITATGVRTFVVVKKVHGKTQRLTLGRYPGLRLEDARQAANGIAGELAHGRDPIATRKAARARKTKLGDLWPAYLAHIKRRNRAWLRDQEKWTHYVQHTLGHKILADITRSDCQSLIDRIGSDHPIAANRTAAFLSALFNFAVRSDRLLASPAKGLIRFSETARTRVLKSDELPRLLTAIETEPEPWADVFKMLLCTGARRGSVLKMRWQDIDLASALWIIPPEVAKNKTATPVPLTGPALAVLKKRLKNSAGEQWVFPSPIGNGHLVGLPKAWGRLIERAGISGLRVHDIRRSVGTALARTGASPHIIAVGLGHRSIASARAYVRLAGEDARQALGDAVASLNVGVTTDA